MDSSQLMTLVINRHYTGVKYVTGVPFLESNIRENLDGPNYFKL